MAFLISSRSSHIAAMSHHQWSGIKAVDADVAETIARGLHTLINHNDCSDFVLLPFLQEHTNNDIIRQIKHAISRAKRCLKRLQFSSDRSRWTVGRRNICEGCLISQPTHEHPTLALRGCVNHLCKHVCIIIMHPNDMYFIEHVLMHCPFTANLFKPP